MPWTAEQARMLRDLGAPWLRTVGGVASDASAQPNPVALPETSDAAGAAQAPPKPTPPPKLQAPAALPPITPLAVIERSESSVLGSLDWDGLRTRVTECRACALCETRTQTVFGVGSSRAHWMIVGEAPGEQEDLKGEPFVGAAGRLLDQMLRPLGLTREVLPQAAPASQVYIANTLKCRPPGNRNPQAEELARCEPFLQRQLELLQPRIIVAMGRFAIAQLLRSIEPVGKLRGRVHRYGGVPLVVTYHPAYLLRNPLDKAKAWNDWCLAAHTYASTAHD